MADDREFFDILYQQWARTTKAETSYWMPVEMANLPGVFKIYAVTNDPETGEEHRKLVAGWMSEADADFVTALHGSLSELIRALIDSHDEVERLDEARDLSQSELAHTLLENMELREEIDELKSQIPSKKEHT